MKAAILGAGVIGAGWAARFVVHGWDVAVWDPDKRVSDQVPGVVARARESLAALYDKPLPVEGRVEVCPRAEVAVADAHWVQESAPETLDIKQKLYAEIGHAVNPQVPVASSTSGFKPSDLAAGADIAGQILVCHPFNPVYLLPGVEVVPGNTTIASVTDKTLHVLEGIGMIPHLIGAEIDAHVADRLLEAVWREALWLVRDGVATTQQIDNIIKTTFGLRWSNLGLFESYRLGGGEGGLRHFIEQFGPALQWPWSRLTDVPELDDELVERIVTQTETPEPVANLQLRRDAGLVALLRALKAVDDGAGRGLNAFEAKRWPTH